MKGLTILETNDYLLLLGREACNHLEFLLSFTARQTGSMCSSFGLDPGASKLFKCIQSLAPKPLKVKIDVQFRFIHMLR